MKTFLNSLRSDLLDRRFLPVLALLGVALAAALAYAVLGGGSSTSSTSPVTSASSGVTGPAGAVAITPAPAANEAVAETTNGSHHSSTPRNPFTPLPSTKAKSSSTATSSSTTKPTPSTANTGSSSSGSSGSGSSSPTTPAKPAKPKPKPQKVYHVDVLFGAAPVGTPPQSIPLTAFNNLTRLYPLAVNGEAPLVFTGVTAGGASAIFTIVREVFPHGPAVCHPSASQCQAIQLAPGQSEELEYILPSGQTLVYRLHLVSITAAKAAAAKAASAFHATSPTGRALLRSAGLSALPGLRYSTHTGVIVLGKHHSFGARAASRHR